MRSMIEYHGYHAAIEYDKEDDILVGTVFGINDVLSFHGRSIEELHVNFANCIDGYLQACAEFGRKPDKEYGGTFNVRIPVEMHRQLALRSAADGVSLNKSVERAIERYLVSDGEAFAAG